MSQSLKLSKRRAFSRNRNVRREIPGTVGVLDYDLYSNAFQNFKIPQKKIQRRKEIRKYRGKKKKDFNLNNNVPNDRIPPRMRRLTKYQSITLPYCYRDNKVSSIYKSFFVVPKSSKYGLKTTHFLTKREKQMTIIPRNINIVKESLREKENRVESNEFNLSTKPLNKKYEDFLLNQKTQLSLRATKRKSDLIFKKKKRVTLYDREVKRERKLRKEKKKKRGIDNVYKIEKLENITEKIDDKKMEGSKDENNSV